MRRAIVIFVLMLGGLVLFGQEDQRSSLQVTTDEDGDLAIVLDTESIRLTILPAYQSCISSIIYKPTGNDILSRQTIKFLLSGSGLLQDNFWEQDWRFSEFRHKWYDYKIVSQGPDELAVKFWTTSVGWLQADKSGVISDLISNIKIERTVRMPAGKPYFLCDITLSIDLEKDKKGHAKLPQFWTHNSSLFTDELSDEYQRPHILGIAEQTSKGRTVSGDYVYAQNMAEGWSAHTSPRTKEGLVYLMDASYVQCLYNCGNSTLEWFADNMLITKTRPLKTRIYILPLIGLDKVHFADPHMILRLYPRLLKKGRHKGSVELRFSVCPSYRRIKKITFETWVTYGLHERDPQKVKMLHPLPVVRNLRVESPRHATGIVKRPDGIAFSSQTPLRFDVTAHIELLDANGRLILKEVKFQYFHLANYPTRKNAHLQGGEPLAKLDRVDARPWLPTPDKDLQINRKQFKLFVLMGPHGRHYRLPEAIRHVATNNGAQAIWDKQADTGYSVGYPIARLGLSNFPYDYSRLFQYRVFINCNTQTDVSRLVGQSILAGYLRAGGGYVSFGGESAYAVPAPRGHALNVFDPVAFRARSIELAPKGKAAKVIVTAPKHPIFTGNGKQAKAIDLSKLPVALSWQALTLKKPTMKPYMPNPAQPIALVMASLPESLRRAITALPPARFPSRDQACKQVYNRLSPQSQRLLNATCRKLFKRISPNFVSRGVPDVRFLDRVRDEDELDIREAFLDHGDDQKELLNEWLRRSFARLNTIHLNSLSPELTQRIVATIDRGLKREGVFIRHGDLAVLPEQLRAELASVLTITHDELPLTARTRVLMELETPDGKRYPFLVETVSMKPAPDNPQKLVPDDHPGRSIAFLNSPFGDPDAFPGHTPYWQWRQWPQVVANAIMYAGGEL